MKHLGKHILVEFYECRVEKLKDEAFIRKVLQKAAQKANATVISTSYHKFTEEGVSGVIMLAESHLSIHTWPEYEYAAVDLFTCGKKMRPWVAFDYMAEQLEAGDKVYMEVKRGDVFDRKKKSDSKGCS